MQLIYFEVNVNENTDYKTLEVPTSICSPVAEPVGLQHLIYILEKLNRKDNS